MGSDPVKIKFEMELEEPNGISRKVTSEEVMLAPERIHRHVIGMAGDLLFNRTTLLTAVVKVFVLSETFLTLADKQLMGQWGLLVLRGDRVFREIKPTMQPRNADVEISLLLHRLNFSNAT